MRNLISQLAWPGLLCSCALILYAGFHSGHETRYFNLSYAWLIGMLWLLERYLNYRPDWRRRDGQTGADLAHTFLNKGLVQLALVSLIEFGALDHREPGAAAEWPLLLQVAVGLLVSEFGLYWAHRVAHEWPVLWRFHAVHHSVKRLWLVNTGRFHFIDSFVSVIAGTVMMLALGISLDAIVWISAITAWIGILTHCNVAMRCGVLNYIFNTPQLHRWHHAVDSRIGNSNYGENLMLWDQIFGTFYWRNDAEVSTIGISEMMPARFLGQLAAPFRWREYQQSGNPDKAM